jgi:GT2 family glycosyltransferase
MIDLSVIIVNWNTSELLYNCLDSLIKGIHKYTLEVIVVDNGSTDGSQDMVRTHFPQVFLMENSTNTGFARANNQALKKAQGRYCLLLNSDTVVRDCSLDGLVDLMESDTHIGMAGLQLLNGDDTFQNSISNMPTLLTELTNKSLLRRIFPRQFPGKEYRPSEPVEVESLVGACLMVRADTIKEIGLLDENYFFFLEETDWCVRARKKGWKVVFHPNLFIYHLQGGSAAKVPARARIEYWHSRYIFFKKHSGPLTYLFLYGGLMIKLVIDFSYASLASIFSHKSRYRFTVTGKILVWHLLGQPRGWGLKPVD